MSFSNRPAAILNYPKYILYNPKFFKFPTLFPNAAVLIKTDGNFAPEPNDTANCPTYYPFRPVNWPIINIPTKLLRNIPQNAGNFGLKKLGFDFGITMVSAEKIMGFGPQIAEITINNHKRVAGNKNDKLQKPVRFRRYIYFANIKVKSKTGPFPGKICFFTNTDVC
ncbi:hypothetical protein PoMZ_02521 [Pyricularia oryzae]|uniref:Uncharacterized protein n=1 Tax=Pyricularia oryzae TaxID=318829 RepID=A0A4P7NBH6_PYROR|nr:hypothetical protein PoMZ_02521 [Pyricularia oryzae]